MKTLANIFTAAIIFFSTTIATAETTSFMMQTADDRFMEVVSKQECELDEEIPSHHLTVKEYIDLSIRILRMPKYIESTLDEEDFQKPADSPPVKFYAKSEQSLRTAIIGYFTRDCHPRRSNHCVEWKRAARRAQEMII